MSLVAVGVTLGTPNSAGEIPITTSNLAASIAQAVTDTTALATAIATAAADATTADTDMGTVQSQMATVKANCDTVVTDTTNTQTTANQAGTDFDTFAAALIAITGDTYNSATKQFTFGGATGLTHAQLAGALGTDLNAIGADIVLAKTRAATAVTDATTADNAAATNVTNCTTAKAATAQAKTDATGLSTATVAADHTAAQAIIASANVLVQTDSSVASSIGAVSGAFIAALTFLRKNNILPL